jgi:cytochrome P450
MPQNIVTTANINVRARMRRLLAPSFNEQSLSNQAPVLEMYAAKLLSRLQTIYDNESKAGKGIEVNILDWVNFYTMDIIGDLAIGESFHCIDGSDYHPWVKTLYNFFKGMILAAAASYFPLTKYLLQNFIPKQILEKQRQHTEFTNTKILQRLELKTQRPDLLTPFVRNMEHSRDKMSLREIQSTFAIILVAGSETPATTLLATFYELASHSGVQEKLFRILKQTFKSESEITVASTTHIPYLDAVINEALRLDYAVPGGLPRVAPEGGDIYAGHYVPAGVRCTLA